MKYLIDIVYLLTLVVISPKIVYRAVKQDRYRTGWSQRLGNLSRKHPEKKCIWIHAVSVGEVNAAKTLISEFKKQLADHEVVISATTDTGYARAQQLYGQELAVFFYPADISCIVSRAFKKLNPSICLLMELEVWPNFATIAEQMNVPVVVVNGRISDRSFPRYKKIAVATKWMFKKVTLVLAQTEEYAERFRHLGCSPERVKVTSSLKYDTAQVAGEVEGADELKGKLNIDNERIWVAGGTGPGEEAIILEVFKKLKQQPELQDLRLAVVPRKPERFEEVAQLIKDSDFCSVRYSNLKQGDEKLQDRPAVILGDTMGDLKKFYSFASVVFVGRTLVPMGGSDMMEPTALGKFTTFGPHTFNFKQTVDVLLDGNGAIQVKDADELFDVTCKALCDTDYANAIAASGQQVIRQNQGATDKTIEEVKVLLER